MTVNELRNALNRLDAAGEGLSVVAWFDGRDFIPVGGGCLGQTVDGGASKRSLILLKNDAARWEVLNR